MRGGKGGGYNNDSPALNTVEAYDPRTDTWTTRAPMPTARFSLSTSAVDGVMYAVGGMSNFTPLNVVEAYDPATDSWSSKTPMPTARYGFAFEEVDDLLYAIGGSRSVSINRGDLGVVQRYNASADAWRAQPPMPTRRALLAGGVVGDTIYAVGGFKPGGPVATLEAFKP